MTMLQVKVYENRELKFTDEFEGPLELGRQDHGEKGPFTKKLAGGQWRLIIAAGSENAIGRHHAFMEPMSDTKVRLRNGTKETPIKFLDRPDLPGQQTAEVPLPLVMLLGTKTIRITAVQPSGLLQSLKGTTAPPRPVGAAPSSKFPSLHKQQAGEGLDPKEAVQWMQTVMDVLQAAAGSADFFERAAQAVVDLVDLDSGRVLLLVEGEWKAESVRTAPKLRGPAGSSRGQVPADELVREPSRRVLNQLLKERRTFWEVPGATGGPMASLAGMEAVVAAPILNGKGDVIGAVYGDRRSGMVPGMAGPITELEALLVELLARGVAAGLARLEQEKAALAARVQFEQFFTPELADQLARHPDWLDGRKCDVSVLFCDIRGFSRISERLPPDRTVEWCKAVLDLLSKCVLEQGGVLVDYVGDGLMALWGAPDVQPDHAARACRAALSMLAGLPALNERWSPELGQKMDLGIGINSGEAVVGNVGSQFKFKYGARGNTVNLASRVEGATKHLKCQLLITGSTKELAGEQVCARRIGRVKVVNIEKPVDLYELLSTETNWQGAKEHYEAGLQHFEAKAYREAARLLGAWRAQADDGPALVLLYRAVRYLVEGTPPEHPVWVLEGK